MKILKITVNILIITGIIILIKILLNNLYSTEASYSGTLARNMSQMNQELNLLDENYSQYFENVCKKMKKSVKINQANTLFNKIEEWKQKRKVIINNYSQDYFGFNTTSRRFNQKPEIIHELAALKDNLNNYEKTSDKLTSVVSNNCNTLYNDPIEDYHSPVSDTVCIIDCYQLKNAARTVKYLSEKEKLYINNSIEKISAIEKTD